MNTILITGSTRGIGKGLAQEFLRLGHRVLLADLPADQIQATVDTNLTVR